MRILGITLLLIFTSCARRSKPTICEYLKLDNCNNSKRSLSRSSGASLPSVNSAAFNNPAAVSMARGVGVESIHYQGNAQLGIVTGTGRIGAAISNNPSDGTFFGNTPIESMNEYRLRFLDKSPLEQDKLALATAVNLFGGKKKKGLQADLGLIYKRHTEKEKDYYGGGLILSYNKFISIGFSQYDDVHYKDFRNQEGIVVDQFGNGTNVIFTNDLYNLIDVEFTVTNTVFGLKFSNIALDYLLIRTTAKEEDDFDPITIQIYNASYFYRQWIFSYGTRFEKSFTEVFDEELKQFITQEEKSDGFLGAQYATSNGFLLGIFHNYYLFDELSLGLTYFF